MRFNNGYSEWPKVSFLFRFFFFLSFFLLSTFRFGRTKYFLDLWGQEAVNVLLLVILSSFLDSPVRRANKVVFLFSYIAMCLWEGVTHTNNSLWTVSYKKTNSIFINRWGNNSYPFWVSLFIKHCTKINFFWHIHYL